MQQLIVPGDAVLYSGVNRKKFTVALAANQEEVREAQRLRYTVFNKTFGVMAKVNTGGVNADEFDDYCDHLIVRDTETARVVGTYRVMSPTAAQRMGRYYAEQEFDLSRLQRLRVTITEAGHACVDPDYRSGGVIMLLWTGLAAYMQRERSEYLVGCASVSVSDGGHNAAALYHALRPENLAPTDYRVIPHVPFPMADCEPGHVLVMPPLLKGYLRSGAWVCGPPAWDRDYNAADFFMLLPMANLEKRYARHYLKTDE